MFFWWFLLVLALIFTVIEFVIKNDKTLDKEIKKFQRCQWTTSYYRTSLGDYRFHIHIIPENDGDHYEAEDGDCQCGSLRAIGHDLVDLESGSVIHGVVYQHRVMTRV